MFVAVVSYLDDRLGTPAADASGIQRLEDLVQSFPYGREQYLNWARGWYP